MEMTVRVAGIVHDSIVDGPGVRVAVFVQGCGHHCKGCHNRQTWDRDGGKPLPVGDVWADIKEDLKSGYVKGLTLSGGEPFDQPGPLGWLALQTHRFSGGDVWAFTGYTLEELAEKAEADMGVRELLTEVDAIVDGPFIEAMRSAELSFMGSSNQRILHREEISRALNRRAV